MASTTLFAPQVPAVQKAFIYDKENLTLEFYLSEYNNVDDFDFVNITVVDPNLNGGWGQNSLVIDQTGIITIQKNNLTIENNRINATINLKTDCYDLVVNQYYQVQIYLGKGNDISLPSQVTLIRPIPAIKSFTIEQFSTSNTTLFTFNRLSGFVQYEDDSKIEQIAECSFKVFNSSDELIYPSKTYKNYLGTSFDIEFNDAIIPEGKDYKLEFTYTTINGYSATINNITFNIGEDDNFISYNFASIDIKNNVSKGAIDLSFNLGLDTKPNINLGEYVHMKIQRANDRTNFSYWEDMLIDDNIDKHATIEWSDYTVEGGVIYRYRVVINNTYIFKYKTKQDENGIIISQTPVEIPCDFEDIMLSDKTIQLAVRYNPNITNFKWVTQENITNTLGGKFPIIRSNKDTYYRQFSISGTLSFMPEFSFGGEHFDSTLKLMKRWMPESNFSLFLNTKESYEQSLRIAQNKALLDNKTFLERYFRDKALEFLTNKELKLFKSTTEGNIIVFLTGVSFTPNKQLGRNVYDFSATATEVCEANLANIKKYCYDADRAAEEYVYVLYADKEAVSSNNNYFYSPYISGNTVINGLPLLHKVKKEDIKNGIIS